MQMGLSSLLTRWRILEESVRRLLIEGKINGLWVNAGKTNVMICDTCLDLLQSLDVHVLAVVQE